MICIVDEIDNRDGIEFRKWIRLSTGIRGKLIELHGYENRYIITEDGNVYNILTEMPLKLSVGNHGYYRVNLAGGSRSHYKSVLVHRLLGLAYIPNPKKYPVINHKNGIKLDISLCNLEWTTYSENNIHAITVLRRKQHIPDSESCNLTTHTIQEVRKVCELLEKGYSPRDIDNMYHVGYWFIIKILRGVTWKDISKEYQLPHVRRHYKGFTISQIDKINRLIRDGYSTKEICKIMDIEYTEKIRGRIKYLKKKLSSEVRVKPL